MSVAAGASVEQDFVAGTGTLQVTLNDAIDRVLGTSAQLVQTLDGQSFADETATASYNLALFRDLASGSYTIEPDLERERGRPGHGVGSCRAGVGASINLSENQFSGVVTDSSNNPLPNAQVIVQPVSGSSQSISTLTGTDGSYSITGITPGSYNVSVLANGYVAQVYSGVSMTGAMTMNAALVASTTEISGELVDQSGNPLAIGSVTVVDGQGESLGQPIKS